MRSMLGAFVVLAVTAATVLWTVQNSSHVQQTVEEATPPFLMLSSVGPVQIPLHLKQGWQDRPSMLSNTQNSQVYVHVEAPVDEHVPVIERLAGSKTLHYIPENTFIMHLSADAVAQIAQLPYVLWVGHVLPEHKLHRAIGDWHKKSPALNKGKILFVVELLPEVSTTHQHAAEIANSWIQQWRNTNGGDIAVQDVEQDKTVTVLAASPHVVRFQSGEGAFASFVKFLSQQEIVHHIHPSYPKRLFNDEASWITQTRVTNSRKIWDKGLRGDNVIIGIGDTGMDYRNCLFDDASLTTVTPCKDCLSTQTAACSFTASACTTASTHRKVAAYWAYVDTLDVEQGHGTHVCGSIAGSTTNANVSIYNGAAPNARIAFTDIGDAEENLSLPSDLNRDYFPFSYKIGARIHTNSWGDDSDDYNTETNQIDTFIYNNKDMLVLFAAGNGGDNGAHTVGSQGNAKNSITVGASRTSYTHMDTTAAKAQAASQYIQTSALLCKASFYNILVTVAGTQMTLCNYIISKVGGTCSSHQTYYCAAIANRAYCNTLQSTSTVNPTTRDAVMALIASNFNIQCSEAFYRLKVQDEDSTLIGITSLASFSSRGPAFDGRIKPDILAPGDIIVSARASGAANTYRCSADYNSLTFSLTTMSGTSMATPTMAGNAALVRQYYTEGFGVFGAKNLSLAPTFVSAALIKATLINSAVQLTSRFDFTTSIRNFGQPSDVYLSGHGLIQLSSTLRFKGDNLNLVYFDYTSKVSSANTGISTGVKFAFKVNVSTAAAPLKVTLVWTDPAASSIASVALVNDLDLIVQTPTTTILGNSAYLSARDASNNVEVVTVASPTVGEHIITVSGKSIPRGPQDFAIVVSFGSVTPFNGPTSANNTNTNPTIENAALATASLSTFVVYVMCLLVLLALRN